jgi:hypothetical protein
MVGPDDHLVGSGRLGGGGLALTPGIGDVPGVEVPGITGGDDVDGGFGLEGGPFHRNGGDSVGWRITGLLLSG